MFRSGPLKGGLQEKMYFLLGCVRCASGKYDLIDRECDFQRKLFKNQILHDIFHRKFKKIGKMKTGYSKNEKMDPWVSKSEGKGTKSEPTGTKSEQKVSQREPKVSQRAPKREPKVSQN